MQDDVMFELREMTHETRALLFIQIDEQVNVFTMTTRKARVTKIVRLKSKG